MDVMLERLRPRNWAIRNARDAIIHLCTSKQSAYSKAKKMDWCVVGTHGVGPKETIRPWDYVKAGIEETP